MSIGLHQRRRRGVLPPAPRRHHSSSSRVGAATDPHGASGSFDPASAPIVPVGFAPIFAGWNVWDIWQADSPSFSVMNVGLSLERQLRVWVENQIKDNAPGADVADPLNPAALRGDQVQPIAHPTGLAIAATRADIPELAGASLNSAGNTATLRSVRFFSRATAPIGSLVTSMAWPHDDDYLLNAVYQPSSSNPITSAPQPGSLAGTASAAADFAGSAIKVLAIGGGVVLAVVLVTSLVNNSRKAAA